MQNAQVRLSNLRVSKWQGNLGEVPDGNEPAPSNEDQLVLFNRDKISGQLLGIKEGQVAFKTAFSAMDIPLPRVRRIVLASAPPPAAITNARPVRLSFASRGTLTLELDHWDDQHVTGRSPYLGELKLVSAAFKTIEFDVAAPKPSAGAASPTPATSTVQPIIRGAAPILRGRVVE
jgi:hypothetical protein